MKIAVVAAAVLATIIPSTAVDASHRQLSTTDNDNNNKPKRRRGQNAVLTSRVKSKVSNVVEIKQQREYTPRQLERDGIITRGVVRGEEQLSMQSIEEPVAIIDEENTPTVIEQIYCNTMNKKQCKRVDIQCSWDGQVCTSSAQVSFLQVDTCAQYTTQKKCRKNSPCEWQEGDEEGESGSCSTPGFVNGIIKPQSNAPTTYSPTTPYPSYFPSLFPTLSPTLSPIDLSISMSMMAFLEEEDMKEETNWPTYSPTLSFPTFSPTLSNIPSNFPITSNPTVSPSFNPTDSPSESPQQPIEEVLPEELVLEEEEEEEEESSNECAGLAWRACKRNPLCDIISKNTECYLISDEGNNRRHLEVDRCTYRTQEKNCIRTVGCTWAGMRGCVNLDLLNHVVPPPLMLDTPRSDLVCPDTLTYLKEIDTSATLHYALVPSTTSSSGYLCARLEVRNHEGWVGIGISNDGKMKDSYAIIGIPNENTVQKYLLGGGEVTLSEEQTLKDTSITQDDDGTMIMKFTKIVEEGDIPIDEDAENIFLHARGGDRLGYHHHRLAFALNLNGRNDTTVEEKEEANPTLPDIEDECSVIEKTKLCQKSEMCAWDDINLRCYIASPTQDTHEAEDVVPIMTPSPTTVSPSLSPVSSDVDCKSINTSRLCHKSEECTWNRNKDRCFPDNLEQSILRCSPSTSPVAFQCSSIKKIRVCRNAVECKWNGDKGKCFPAPIQDLEEASTSLSASPVTQKPTLYPSPATPEPTNPVMCADLKKQRLCRKQNYCTWDRQESNCFGTPPSVSPTSSPTPNPTREQVPTASPVSRSDIIPRIDGPCADLSMRLCIKKNGGICEWKREVGYGYCSPIVETGTEDVRRLVNDQADQEWGRTMSQSKQQYYRQMMSMPMQVAEMSMPEESYTTESFFEAVQVQDNDPESMRQLSQPSSADFHISEFAWEDEEEGSSRGEISVDKRYMKVGLSASARASNLSMSIYYFTIIFGSVMWCVM